jgi:hypothetical protein
MYILKLHHVENGKYSKIHSFLSICTSLENLKKRGKMYNYFLKIYLNAY